MNFRIETKWFTFYIGLKRIEWVNGYNSDLPDGRHFLMWDFDEVELADVKRALFQIQVEYNLSSIYIIPTGKDNHFHANCFKSFEWHKARAIIARTLYVDKKFVGIGILRGFFTLRYSPIGGREFEQAVTLPSMVAEDVNPLEFTSFITYSKVRRW